MQARMFDATTLISYLEAKSRNDAPMENVLYRRFRPGAKKAIDAWLATDPLTNSAAAINPFDSPEYMQPELEEARRQEDLASKSHATAQEASKHSDNYVLLTVLFASVLFFGGIGGTFESFRLRLIVISVALVLLTGTLVAMLLMPITAANADYNGLMRDQGRSTARHQSMMTGS
jgi:hypothetical protein